MKKNVNHRNTNNIINNISNSIKQQTNKANLTLNQINTSTLKPAITQHFQININSNSFDELIQLINSLSSNIKALNKSNMSNFSLMKKLLNHLSSILPKDDKITISINSCFNLIESSFTYFYSEMKMLFKKMDNLKELSNHKKNFSKDYFSQITPINVKDVKVNSTKKNYKFLINNASSNLKPNRTGSVIKNPVRSVSIANENDMNFVMQENQLLKSKNLELESNNKKLLKLVRYSNNNSCCNIRLNSNTISNLDNSIQLLDLDKTNSNIIGIKNKSKIKSVRQKEKNKHNKKHKSIRVNKSEVNRDYLTTKNFDVLNNSRHIKNSTNINVLKQFYNTCEKNNTIESEIESLFDLNSSEINTDINNMTKKEKITVKTTKLGKMLSPKMTNNLNKSFEDAIIIDNKSKRTKTHQQLSKEISELNLEKQKLIHENNKLLEENKELLNKLNADEDHSKKTNTRFEGQVLLLSRKNNDLTQKINEISESKRKLLGVIKDNEKKLNEYNELLSKYIEMSKVVKNYEKKSSNDNNKIFELTKSNKLLESKNRELTKKLKISNLKLNDLNISVRVCDNNNELKDNIKILENKISDLNTTIIREEIEKSELNDNIKELDKKNNRRKR